MSWVFPDVQSNYVSWTGDGLLLLFHKDKTAMIGLRGSGGQTYPSDWLMHPPRRYVVRKYLMMLISIRCQILIMPSNPRKIYNDLHHSIGFVYDAEREDPPPLM